MRTFNKVKVEDVHYKDGKMEVKTNRAGSYQLALENHYEVDSKRKLEELTKSVDMWISDVYNLAARKNTQRPFVADVDTSSGKVLDVRASISSSRLPKSIHHHIDGEYSASTSVRAKR